MVITVANRQKKLPINRSQIKKYIKKILKKVKKEVKLFSAVFVGNEEIRELNNRFFKSRHLTDVISFDNSFSKAESCWEVIICADTALKNAAAFKTSADFEIKLYLAHGILHLAGFDDKTPAQKKIMRSHEKAILKNL